MQHDFWEERWEQNQIAFHQPDVNAALQAHWPRLGLSEDALIFVPLCGKSRDMRWLRDRGHRVLGVEIVEIAVRDFFADNGLRPVITAQPPFKRYAAAGITLLCGDFFDLTAADLAAVAGVYDRASLIAFPPSMRARYVAKLAETLPARVEMLLISMTYPQEEMDGPPFSVPEREVRALYADNFRVERLAERDVLPESPRFRERGLTQLSAQVYRVRR